MKPLNSGRTKRGTSRLQRWMRTGLDKLSRLGQMGRQLANRKGAILVVVSLAISFVLSPHLGFMVKRYQPGDVVGKDLKAPLDLMVEDWQATEKRRAEATNQVPAIYDLDLHIISQLEGRIVSAFAQARETPGGVTSEAFLNTVGISLSDSALAALRRQKFSLTMERATRDLVRGAQERGVVVSKEGLSLKKGTNATLRRIPQGGEGRLSDFEAPLAQSEVKKFVVAEVQAMDLPLNAAARAALVELATNLVRPNVAFNQEETERRKVAVINQVPPILYEIKKGEMILREGERVKAEDLPKLNALAASLKSKDRPWLNLGFGLLVLLILGSTYIFAHRNVKKFPRDITDHLFLALALFGSLAWVKVSVAVSDAVGVSFPAIPATSYYYAIPFAAGAMLVRFLINSETAVIFAILVSMLSGMIFENNIFFSIYAFVGCIVGAHAVGHCEQRSALVKAGFLVGAVNLAMAVLFSLVAARTLTAEAGFNAVFGFLGGIIAAILVTGITPLIELLFGYTSNIKLLELANMDHPLLKRLILEAPGTYHHSVVTGTMAEAAARAIGANPLLARVSSYYHDIGKCRKPEYFVENQCEEESKHERLTPHMSGLILVSHVKEGLEMAKEYRLGRRIMDIIPQHHGTGLIRYFYHKALETQDPEAGKVDEEDFRYPGPKPQTREAGLVMLADQVEAATHVLEDPSPARLQSLVQKIINDIFLDGQLEECELTLKDLHAIADSFTHTLLGVYHHRIKYPEVVGAGSEAKRMAYAGADWEPTEGNKTEPSENKENRRGGLKKTGLP